MEDRLGFRGSHALGDRAVPVRPGYAILGKGNQALRDRLINRLAFRGSDTNFSGDPGLFSLKKIPYFNE